MTGPSGVAAFLAVIESDARSRWDVDGLADALSLAVSRAQRAWPTLAIDADELVAWLAPRIADLAGPPAIAGLRIEALALAFACTRNDSAAIALFEREHARDIDLALMRSHVPSAAVTDVRQRVLERLFVGPSAKIASYSGRGELCHWVRTVATRVAVSSQRGRAPLDRVIGTPSAVPDSPRDPELDWLRRQYQQEFRAAFGVALATLDEDDRVMLRFKFVDGLTLDDLARLYGIHRATVARRLAAIRESVVQATREHLGGPLRVRRQDLASLVRLVRSDFELSLSRLLADT